MNRREFMGASAAAAVVALPIIPAFPAPVGIPFKAGESLPEGVMNAPSVFDCTGKWALNNDVFHVWMDPAPPNCGSWCAIRVLPNELELDRLNNFSIYVHTHEPLPFSS